MPQTNHPRAPANNDQPSARHPQPASALSRRVRLDRAYEEFCHRVEQGEEINIEDFCQGNPDLASTLHRQLLIHDALDDHLSWALAACESFFPECGRTISGFRLVELIGRGAFSRVYLAVDDVLGERQVVIKVCQAGAHEAWIQGKLQHDHIMPIFSITEDEEYGCSVICMPYLGRVTLRDKISAYWNSPEQVRSVPARVSQHLPGEALCIGHVEQVIRLGIAVAEALAYAHGHGVLHLDLKPSNILIDESGSPRLLDFNLSADHRRGIACLGGTLAYMAPEQARAFLDGGDGTHLDGRADIFALGAMLYEMLCGHRPFDPRRTAVSSRTAVQDQLEQQLQGIPLPWPPGRIDAGLRRIVERCLAADPADRYPAASALVADLQRQQSFLRRSRRWLRQRRRAAVALVAVVLVAVSGVSVGLACRDPFPVRQFQAGRADWDAGDLDAAASHLSQALCADANQPDVLRARAQVRALTGDYHSALEDLRALGRLCTDGRDLALKAYCCNQVDLHLEAIGFYRDAIRSGYAQAAVYNNLGYSCYLRARYDEALESLDTAVSLREHVPTALYNRAIVHHALAVMQAVEPKAAMEDMDNVLRLGLCRADTYYWGAVVYGYASSLNAVWRERARVLTILALQHGIAETTIRSDPFLAPYAGEWQAAGSAAAPENGRLSTGGSHFIYPLGHAR